MLPERVRAIAQIGDVGNRISLREIPVVAVEGRDVACTGEAVTRAAKMSAKARSRNGSGWNLRRLTGRTIQVLEPARRDLTAGTPSGSDQ
jgi:hypothetical protein